MAEEAVQLDREQFCCPICLDLLKDPVTVPCGHNYCSRCIEAYWNQVAQIGRFSCAQCRQTFIPRPVLKKNIMLADMMDLLKKVGPQAVPPDHCYAGTGDVACDSCTGRKLKAVSTCLQCLVSYCDTHIQPHYQSPAFKTHKLVKVPSQLQENLQKRIQEREEEVKGLHQQVESINHCADRAVEKSDTIFTEFISFISSIERRRSEVREQIRDQQKCEVSHVEEQKKHVEKEVTELRRRHAELEQLSHTEDHIHFLHSSTSLSEISESKHPLSINVRPLKYFEHVTVAVSKIRDELEDMLKETKSVNRVDVLLSALPEPKTRAKFLQYSCPITLDPNTAHENLSLSKGNRKVIQMYQQQSHPYSPWRFNVWWQVLSTEGLPGRCYWEVKWSGSVDIAVSYKDIRTPDDECRLGYNDNSWSLQCCNDYYIFRHRGIETQIPGPVSSRVGVYLDHSAGTLSYSVSDTMTLIHRVQTTFTQTLYAGFGFHFCHKGTAELCDLK